MTRIKRDRRVARLAAAGWESREWAALSRRVLWDDDARELLLAAEALMVQRARRTEPEAKPGPSPVEGFLEALALKDSKKLPRWGGVASGRPAWVRPCW